MASKFRTGFYQDGGSYGQEYLGDSIEEALDNLASGDIDRIVHDHVYTDWEIDREGIASAIAYEDLLDYTKENIAEDALEKIRDDTDNERGPVYGDIYWWETDFLKSPRAPPEAVKPPIVNVKWTANIKSRTSKSKNGKKTTNGSKASRGKTIGSGLSTKGKSKGRVKKAGKTKKSFWRS